MSLLISYIFLIVNKPHKKTKTNIACIYEQLLCLLCHRALLLSDVNELLHRVTCSFTYINTHTVVQFDSIILRPAAINTHYGIKC